jgi:hypothetical protein
MTPWLNILAGIAVLLFGRQLFWLFVAVAGFAAGSLAAVTWLGYTSEWVILAVGLGAGLVGAILSVFLQRLVVTIAGFFAGAYLGHDFAVAMGHPTWALAGAIIGAILGALFVMAIFDWALVFLSAMTGAAMVAQALGTQFPRMDPNLVFAGLAVFGVIVQGSQLLAKAREPKPEKK